MITTQIESINNTEDVDILKTAAKLGVKYYRTNWFKYADEKSMMETLEKYQKQVISSVQAVIIPISGTLIFRKRAKA